MTSSSAEPSSGAEPSSAAESSSTAESSFTGPPRRRRAPWIFAALVLLLAFDLARAPERQLTGRALVGMIDLYQATLSPRMPSAGVQCRFTPTCSHYAEAVIREHGALVGSMRAGRRIARCGPWTPAGTHDPP